MLIKKYINYLKTFRYIKLISYIIANWLYNIIQESDDEIVKKIKKYRKYKYYFGTEVIIGYINKGIPIILIGLVLNILPQMILTILSFAVLRNYSGGLHLDSYTKCCYYSFIIFTLTALLAKYIPFNDILNVITYIVTFIIIFIYAPVEHPNRPLTEKEKVKFKSISMFILGVLFVIAHYVDVTISNCITYGILLAGLITLPVINKLK